MSTHRYRIRFTKTGLLRWTSHRDLARLWERMVRRCGLRLAMSAGFSPKPRISFPAPLALGLESLDEVLEITLLDEIAPTELQQRLEGDETSGLEITNVTAISSQAPKPQFFAAQYQYHFATEELHLQEEIGVRIAALRIAEKMAFTRKGKIVEAVLEEQLLALECDPTMISMTIKGTSGASLRPTDVLETLGLGNQSAGRLVRTRTILDQPSEQSLSPSFLSSVRFTNH